MDLESCDFDKEAIVIEIDMGAILRNVEMVEQKDEDWTNPNVRLVEKKPKEVQVIDVPMQEESEKEQTVG